MTRKKTASFGSIGTSSLLTAFGVLCITVFALLSLSTVQAERRLSESAWQTVAGYYEADLEAQKILAKLRSGQVIEGVQQQGEYYVYQCGISQNQHLAVTVACQEESYSILCWQVVYDGAPAEETPANLWTGRHNQEGDT